VAKIDDVQIPSLLFTEGSAPSTPASGFGRIYVKTTGLFFIGDNGVEIGPLAAATSSATGTIIGRAKARHSSTQSVSTGSDTALLFDSETGGFDTGTIHDTGSNTSRFVAPTGSVVARVDAYITLPLSANATEHQIQSWFRVDGTTAQEPRTRALIPASTQAIKTMHVAGWIPISAASYIECMVNQASGGSLNFGHATANANNRIEVVFFN
jgi:hypothetical protein